MSSQGKFAFEGKKKIASFGCTVVVAVVAVALLDSDAWVFRSSSRGVTSIIPVPRAAVLVLCWLGGWFIIIFSKEESDYRWRGAALVLMSLIFGAVLFARFLP